MKAETAKERAKMSAEIAIAMKSLRSSGFLIYQVRFFFLPNPRRSIALVITSILSSVEKMRGMTMSKEFLKRSVRGAFAESSRPRAC